MLDIDDVAKLSGDADGVFAGGEVACMKIRSNQRTAEMRSAGLLAFS